MMFNLHTSHLPEGTEQTEPSNALWECKHHSKIFKHQKLLYTTTVCIVLYLYIYNFEGHLEVVQVLYLATIYEGEQAILDFTDEILSIEGLQQHACKTHVLKIL